MPIVADVGTIGGAPRGALPAIVPSNLAGIPSIYGTDKWAAAVLQVSGAGPDRPGGGPFPDADRIAAWLVSAVDGGGPAGGRPWTIGEAWQYASAWTLDGGRLNTDVLEAGLNRVAEQIAARQEAESTPTTTTRNAPSSGGSRNTTAAPVSAAFLLALIEGIRQGLKIATDLTDEKRRKALRYVWDALNARAGGIPDDGGGGMVPYEEQPPATPNGCAAPAAVMLAVAVAFVVSLASAVV